jgi:hypothetical protein
MPANLQRHPHLPESAWRKFYENAVLELDVTALPTRIAVARTAIYDRAEEVLGSNPASSECRSLQDALRVLEVLENMPKAKKSA